MAGDWIKMRTDLYRDPRVLRISTILCPENVPEPAHRWRVIGCLYGMWTWADEQSVDGFLRGVSAKNLDDYLLTPGWTGALSEIGWIEVTTQGVRIPRFKEHNGASAKRRAKEQRRKQVYEGRRNLPAQNPRKTRASNARKSAIEQEQQQQQEESREDKSKASSNSAPADVVRSLGDAFSSQFAAAASGEDFNLPSAVAAAAQPELSPTRIGVIASQAVAFVIKTPVVELSAIPSGVFVEALVSRGCPGKMALKAITQVNRQLLQLIVRVTENPQKVRTGGGWNRILFKPQTFGLVLENGFWQHEERSEKGVR